MILISNGKLIKVFAVFQKEVAIHLTLSTFVKHG